MFLVKIVIAVGSYGLTSHRVESSAFSMCRNPNHILNTALQLT